MKTRIEIKSKEPIRFSTRASRIKDFDICDFLTQFSDKEWGAKIRPIDCRKGVHVTLIFEQE